MPAAGALRQLALALDDELASVPGDLSNEPGMVNQLRSLPSKRYTLLIDRRVEFGASARPNELAARLLDLRAGGTTAHMIIDQTH